MKNSAGKLVAVDRNIGGSGSSDQDVQVQDNASYWQTLLFDLVEIDKQ